MPTNKRIFYATQGVKLIPVDAEGAVDATALVPGGIQSVGVNTNYNLERVFQLGQLELYDTIENNPEVQVTLNKVFDGTKPLFLMTMGGASNVNQGSIVEFQNNRVNLELYVHQDTNQGTSGANAVSVLSCTGLYASSFTYTFPTDGNLTEEVTLVGNTKTWAVGGGNDDAIFADSVNSRGLGRRWKFDTSANGSVFPIGSGGMPSGSPLNNVTVSFDLGREAIYTLGSYVPYLRFVNFPLEITTEITSIAQDGDFLNIDEDTYSCTSSSSATLDKPIKFVICGSGANDSLTIDLGDKNKLQSVNYTGGDTGGGNVQISYSFTTNNTFIMSALGSFQEDALGN